MKDIEKKQVVDLPEELVKMAMMLFPGKSADEAVYAVLTGSSEIMEEACLKMEKGRQLWIH